jgi:diaminopimelate dehydrogenase
MSIRIGIFGYGNLGRGVESAIRQNPDMELAAVFTRRDPATRSFLKMGIDVILTNDYNLISQVVADFNGGK